jgi:hypothetical protein
MWTSTVRSNPIPVVRSNPIPRVLPNQPHECGHLEQEREQPLDHYRKIEP